MPHSSGGGFHGSGFHGGSHGSFRTGSVNSVPYRHFSNIRFNGARTFCYYNKNQINYIYSDKNLSKTGPAAGIPLPIRIFMTIALIVIILTSVYACFPKPKLPSLLLKSNRIYIEDDTDIFTDKEEKALEDTLQRFYEETGIPVGISTCYNSNFNGTATQYAYNKYLDTYKDEGHWLIVFYTKNPNISSFGALSKMPEWGFEGMQGDYTDYLLTNEKTLEFNKTLYNYLDSTKMSYANCIMKTFDEFTPTVRTSFLHNPTENEGAIIFAIILTALTPLLTFFFLYIKSFTMILTGVKFYEVKDHKTVIICKECGHEYIENEKLKCCPHCNNSNSHSLLFQLFHRDNDDIE